MSEIKFFNSSKLPTLGKYKRIDSEEIIELDNIYMNNIGVYYGIRSDKNYETGILTFDFWKEFEEIPCNDLRETDK